MYHVRCVEMHTLGVEGGATRGPGAEGVDTNEGRRNKLAIGLLLHFWERHRPDRRATGDEGGPFVGFCNVVFEALPGRPDQSTRHWVNETLKRRP